MELSLAIRKGLFSALSGIISAPVFDAYALPENTPYPYVLLSSQTSVQRLVDTCRVYDATVLIDIVTGSADPIGRAQSEMIASEIEAIVNPDNNIDIYTEANGYRISYTNREQDFDSSARNGGFYIFRKLLRYRFLVQKL